MTEKDHQARIAGLEAENRQLREMLNHEVSEVESLTEQIHELKEEFAEAYAKLESELAETKLALASNQKGGASLWERKAQ